MTDAAAAGPMADADADDSWHLPPVLVHVEDLCCEPLFVADAYSCVLLKEKKGIPAASAIEISADVF